MHAMEAWALSANPTCQPEQVDALRGQQVAVAALPAAQRSQQIYCCFAYILLGYSSLLSNPQHCIHAVISAKGKGSLAGVSLLSCRCLASNTSPQAGQCV
jgi:hypothetical protein